MASQGGYPYHPHQQQNQQQRFSSFHAQPNPAFDLEQSVHLVRDELQDSMIDSHGGLLSDALSKRDEKIVLIQDSCPNYAKINHFEEGKEEKAENIVTPTKKSNAPSINEQVRKIKEQLAKEFDEKYQKSIEEIDLFKAQLESNAKESEKRQNQIFTRQLMDKDRLIQQLNALKTEQEAEIAKFETIVAEKEDLIQNQKEAIDRLKGEAAKASKIVADFDLRQEVVNQYLESTKKSQEEMKAKYEQAVEALGELRKQDWSKQIMELKRENDFLREEVNHKQKEIAGLKNNIAMAISTSGSANVQSHLTNLLENQSKENVRLNRLIQEYDKKEKQCTRKWNALLQENLQLQEKVTSSLSQLKRQREQFQAILATTERKVIEANQRLAFVQHSEEKRLAAEYLVDQIRVAGDEKQVLLQENDSLHLKLQEINDEYQRLYSECRDYLTFKQNPNVVNSDSHSRLLLRIEELEDLVVELKQQQSPGEQMDLRSLLLAKEQENQTLQGRVEELRRQRIGAKALFEQNELYESFAKSIEERDQQINRLKGEISQVKNTQFIQHLQQQTLPKPVIGEGLSRVRVKESTFTRGDDRDEWLVQKFPTPNKAEMLYD